MSDNNVQSVIVIGGGLVGALCATFMAKKGFNVTLYEYRGDIRQAKLARGRSINLALSNRGRRALKAVGLEDAVLKTAIPMKGRLLHNEKGQTKSVLYDPNTKQCIYSVGRNYLNGILLTALESHPNVKVLFDHKLVNCNFDEGSVTLLNLENEKTVTATADLIIGADGAFSAVRRCMQQTPLFEFSQTYIPHGYMELSIPPSKGHLMIPNHLHIWPRGEFMMIALPNQDKSWTVTLFMPFSKFEALTSESSVGDFFQKTFPDSIPLIGREELVRDFLKSKPSHLVSIKCNPYHVGTKFMLIGDAAHAVVPFYGQGMNAGFEDCVIWSEILENNANNIPESIREFSRVRIKDAYAISDLAMYNYVEMRDLVTKNSYHFRKKIDDFLFKCLPNFWIPLYNSVTFTSLEYKACMENRAWQDKVIHNSLWVLATCGSVALSFCTVGYWMNHK